MFVIYFIYDVDIDDFFMWYENLDDWGFCIIWKVDFIFDYFFYIVVKFVGVGIGFDFELEFVMFCV